MRSTRIRRAHTSDELCRRLQRLHTRTPSCRKLSRFLVCIRPSRLVSRGSHQSAYHRYTDGEKSLKRVRYMLAAPHRWEPAKVKLGHEVGKWGKPSASFADGAEGERIPPGGGGRRRDSARNPRPWAARCAGGLNADSEFRTLGDIPKRKSSLPTLPRRMRVGTPSGPQGRIRLPVVIPLNGEDRVPAEWDASEAIGEKAGCGRPLTARVRIFSKTLRTGTVHE
jgi:hypothetical protein